MPSDCCSIKISLFKRPGLFSLNLIKFSLEKLNVFNALREILTIFNILIFAPNFLAFFILSAILSKPNLIKLPSKQFSKLSCCLVRISLIFLFAISTFISVFLVRSSTSLFISLIFLFAISNFISVFLVRSSTSLFISLIFLFAISNFISVLFVRFSTSLLVSSILLLVSSAIALVFLTSFSKPPSRLSTSCNNFEASISSPSLFSFTENFIPSVTAIIFAERDTALFTAISNSSFPSNSIFFKLSLEIINLAQLLINNFKFTGSSMDIVPLFIFLISSSNLCLVTAIAP